MKTRYVILAGAGATVCDAAKRARLKRPPLDKGFFRSFRTSHYPEFEDVRRYLERTYGFNPSESPERDSLEAIMAIIYADMYNPSLERDAVAAFRALIRLFNHRVAETTNTLEPTNRFALYRMICLAIDSGIAPDEICIITFNQDLQIEKVLERINLTSRKDRHGRVFNFPYCYGIPNIAGQVTSPSGQSSKTFDLGDQDQPVLRILKLHGSLNWYSTHHTRDVPKNAILNANRKCRVTTRREIPTSMTVSGRRREYTFPLIVPPVTHKAGILPGSLIPVWQSAETALKNARGIVVFGYSCPETDCESANLLRRTVRQNSRLTGFNVIDPNPAVFQRYVDLTRLDRLHYFRNAEAYFSWAARQQA